MKTKIFTFYIKEKPLSKIEITSADKIFKRMRPIIRADQESFWVVGVNMGLKEIYHDCLFIGGMDKCIIDSRILFKRLLTVGASGFFLIHNHPSGAILPSMEDIQLTNKIKKMADILDLTFLDHLIISDGGYSSLKDEGLLS